ncbi:hypothetical protein FOF52_17255 [Thermobifida alba]|uniref:ESAT-6-like protein n=1 Tax=Thermobifida alba TaxID=53522 RepID=A0ABY4L7P8_THEAE|nr:WXG100 family type VII secretion target [Thermobifida alba]UPT22493.1 hypothetical protein FOF52_17255 [Thermobifida alba]
MGNQYEVYGNVGGLQDLAATQQGYLGRFQGIMEQIDSQAKDTVGKWEGSGSPEFQAKAEEYNTHFSAVNDAFAKLIDATDGAANNYAKLSNYLNGLF